MRSRKNPREKLIPDESLCRPELTGFRVFLTQECDILSLGPDIKKVQDWVFIWLPVILHALCVVMYFIANENYWKGMSGDYMIFLYACLFVFPVIALIKLAYATYQITRGKRCLDPERCRRGRRHLVSSLLMFFLCLIFFIGVSMGAFPSV